MDLRTHVRVYMREHAPDLFGQLEREGRLDEVLDERLAWALGQLAVAVDTFHLVEGSDEFNSAAEIMLGELLAAFNEDHPEDVEGEDLTEDDARDIHDTWEREFGGDLGDAQIDITARQTDGIGLAAADTSGGVEGIVDVAKTAPKVIGTIRTPKGFQRFAWLAIKWAVIGFGLAVLFVIWVGGDDPISVFVSLLSLLFDRHAWAPDG